MKYSALDPGMRTGFADFEDFVPLTMGEIICTANSLDGLLAWLQVRKNLDYLIVEGYRNRPVGMTRGHANTWSTNLESQIIGLCKGFCLVNEINFIEQDASIKPVGYGMAGLKYVKGKKGQHKQDALAHASYWYRTKGCKL